MVDKICYFAYGSNMLSRRLCAVDRAPSAVAVGIGFVKARRLTFDKVSFDGSGKCDIESTGNSDDRVYGVLYSINESEKLALDVAEGLGKGYAQELVDVLTSSGNCAAIAYVATNKEPALRPYHWYKDMVIAGAVENHLPESYIEWIRTVDSKPDLNINRRIDDTLI